MKTVHSEVFREADVKEFSKNAGPKRHITKTLNLLFNYNSLTANVLNELVFSIN